MAVFWSLRMGHHISLIEFAKKLVQHHGFTFILFFESSSHAQMTFLRSLSSDESIIKVVENITPDFLGNRVNEDIEEVSDASDEAGAPRQVTEKVFDVRNGMLH
ncbi:hypothetical protein Cni_G20938 [Canna indica]|uniref:Uncharacterized protein n=1 Tax=Canna indica TaxID=4628 RepID=A0AAQ3KS65_9LILI|nr:hypothetical protein Cni_G20938 [Canna indica]